MKVCLICVELFAWGKYGGFGRATRIIGSELSKHGIDVFAVVPQRNGQKAVENLDGITVFGFPPHLPYKAKKLLENCNADIYHSCEPSLASYIALKTMPQKKHLVTLRDPRDFTDWKIEFMYPSLNRFQVLFNYFYENNYLIRQSINHMDKIYTAANCLIPKAKKIYGLSNDPQFLPTPVTLPKQVNKAESPTVCFVSRLDKRKRPTLFLELAKKFPSVRFLVIGHSRDKKWESYLRQEYAYLPNITFYGFIDQFRSKLHQQFIGKSWIIINTALREGLPNAFLEAAASKCAILSYVNPDGFATKFGYHAEKHDFAEGLDFLLENDRWRRFGESGHQHIRNVFETNKSIQRHLDIYQEVMNI